MSHMHLDAQDPLWFKDAIIYELHIKAFADANADGIGDFQGLIERLDYLQELGVTAIWLLPFYPSPQRDGGYDISDYYKINPDYGTIKQFKRLMKLAHERGLKVITELVINHTSDQHPWFQRARKSSPGSKYRDYYVWNENQEKYQDVRIIFQDFESSNWTWDAEAQAYYWHRFYSHQPDLNYDNPAVQEEVFRIIDFWIDLGVDGFRLDAVPYLFERDGTNCENLPETHAYLKKLRAHVEKKNPQVMLLAEANMWPEDSASYFGDGDECHMNYHFPIMPRMFMALKMEDRFPITDIIDQTPDIPENCQWGMFLRNHDELTLEMVTDEERDYMYRAYNKDALSRINLGIRHRLAPLLDNHRQKIELMNCLLFSMPGTPVVYYGDEIGMGDNVHLGDRDGVRTPMQWSPDRNAGFSRAHPHKLFLPLINDPEYHYETVNVETQQNNSSSLFWWMKRMINVRKRYQAFGRGNIQFLNPDNAKVLAFTRSYQGQHLLILANLSRHPQAVELDLPDFLGYQPIEMFGQTSFPRIRREGNRFTLGAYGYYWFVLKGLETQPSLSPLPELEFNLDNWPTLLKGKKLQKLADEFLPSFLKRSQRYTLPKQTLERLEVEKVQIIPAEKIPVAFLIIKAYFTEGFPEWYFLALHLEIQDVSDQQSDPPAQDKTLLILKEGEQRGYLIEAMHHPSVHQFFLKQLLRLEKGNLGNFRFIRSSSLNGQKLSKEDLPTARRAKLSGLNHPLVFGDQYYLKIFRRLDSNPNPDLEINRSAPAGLPIPGYLAHLEYRREGSSPFTLALLQPYVSNQGSAWQYFFDASRRYFERIETQSDLPKPERFFPSLDQAMPQPWQDLLTDMPLERAHLLGATVGRLHLGLMDQEDPQFKPESFSLHYQRSLFSSFQSLVRSTFQHPGLKKMKGKSELLEQRKDLLAKLKRIYSHKIEAQKIRIHSDLHLEKVLFTGVDFCIFDFEGERNRDYSELRLRKSPVRDLATLMASLYYVSLNALQTLIGTDESLYDHELLPWAEAWATGMEHQLTTGYFSQIKGSGVLPDTIEDWTILRDCFFLERHMYELGYELSNDRGMAQIPFLGLLRLLRQIPELA